MKTKKTLLLKFAAQKKLMITWLIAALVVTLLFVLICWQRTSNTGFDESLQWLFNYIGPGLTLMIGTFAYMANQPSSDPPKYIDKSYFRITLYFSLVYMLALLAVILITPMALDDSMTLNDYIKKFNLLLSFLQTSLLVLLSIFFTRENH
jgi:MFS superfamily sulfate permease-like transporter